MGRRPGDKLTSEYILVVLFALLCSWQPPCKATRQCAVSFLPYLSILAEVL